MKPSCAVTKLIDADGCRPSSWYRSLEPVKRDANDAAFARERQKSRIVSRYWSFHSVQSTGKLPDLVAARARDPTARRSS